LVATATPQSPVLSQAAIENVALAAWLATKAASMSARID
jgi:hypothetical protein